MSKITKWTQEEIETLKEGVASGKSWEKMSVDMGRSVAALRSKYKSIAEVNNRPSTADTDPKLDKLQETLDALIGYVFKIASTQEQILENTKNIPEFIGDEYVFRMNMIEKVLRGDKEGSIPHTLKQLINKG